MNIAFFDFDGTITSGDSFLPFIRSAAPRHRVFAGALCLSPMIAGYHLGWVPAPRIRASIARFAFRGRALSELTALGERYATRVLPQRVRAVANERIAWHQAQGDEVVVVSASLDCYLAPWCRARGLQLVCTELETRVGVCTGRYRQGDCSGPEKARRILARWDLRRYAQVFAYGDTSEDSAMLGLAHRRYLRWQEVTPGGPFPPRPPPDGFGQPPPP